MTLPTSDPVVTPPTSGAATPPTETPPQPSSGATPPIATKDWEASYKGLQSSTDKKISDLTAARDILQEKYNALNLEHETLKRTLAEINANKSALETSDSALREQLKTVIAEKDRLATQQRQQTLVLKQFPQLAPFTMFIPSADTDEAYLENAKAFAETLKGYIDLGARAIVSGAVPPAPTPGPTTVQTSAEDLAWTKVASLAGVPGKEVEYEAALDEWTKLKAPQ